MRRARPARSGRAKRPLVLGTAAAGKRAKASEPAKLIDAFWSLCAEVPSGRFGSMKVSVETPWVVSSSRIVEKLSAAPTKMWESLEQGGATAAGVAGLVNKPKADDIAAAHEASLGEGRPEQDAPADAAEDQQITVDSKDNVEEEAVEASSASWSWSQALDEVCRKWLLHPLTHWWKVPEASAA